MPIMQTKKRSDLDASTYKLPELETYDLSYNKELTND